MRDVTHPDLQAAAATWNKADETLSQTNARIHDGVPDDAVALADRADGYVEHILSLFSIDVPQHAAILEIGSGTGYVMEAMERRLASLKRPARSIDGLDVAEHMLAKARGRLGDRSSFGFVLYDGVNVPKPDQSYDLIYSVASLQHVPKPYVYNLFFEIKRLLRPGGNAVVNVLSWDHLAAQEALVAWRSEITAQIGRHDTHWHHFYSTDELDAVLRVGTGFPSVQLIKSPTSIWFCAGDRSATPHTRSPRSGALRTIQKTLRWK